MNQVEREILKSIVSIRGWEKGTFVARVKFPVNFIGFNGHFIDQPILPAICMLETVKCVLSKWLNNSITIEEIVLAKFYNIISDKEHVDLKIEQLKVLDNSRFLYKIEINREDIKKATFKLKVKKKSN